jgi:hypothetical protein
VLEPHRHPLERPGHVVGVQTEGRAGGASQCREEQLVRVGSGVLPSGLDWLVGLEEVWAGEDRLAEPRPRIDHDFSGFHRLTLQ